MCGVPSTPTGARWPRFARQRQRPDVQESCEMARCRTGEAQRPAGIREFQREVAGYSQELDGPSHDVCGGDSPEDRRSPARLRRGGGRGGNRWLRLRTQRRRAREHGLGSEWRARTVEDPRSADPMTTVRIVPASGVGALHFHRNGCVIGASVGIGRIARESPGRPSRTIAFRRETRLQAISSLGPMTTQDVDRSLRLRKGRTMTRAACGFAPDARRRRCYWSSPVATPSSSASPRCA